MIRCIIIDDEPIARQILEQYIMQTPGLTLLASCRNAMEGFAMLEQHQVDLVFLDIEMPLVNGLNFIRSLTSPPAIILTTAYPQYAVDAFDLNATDYLLKPFSLDRFRVAIAKVSLTTSPDPEPSTLLIREKGALMKIPHQEIIYLQASRDYVKIITPQKQYLISATMKSLEETLPAGRFIRIHKSYIVQVQHVQLVRPAELVMSNKEVLPLSPYYKEELMRVYSKI